MSLFGLAVTPDENARHSLARGSLATVAFLRPPPNAPQYLDARLKIAARNAGQ
jgi:hypothetical protein